MSYLNEIKQNLESLQKREGSLAQAIRGLDALLAEHRSALSPQLQHYLSQRSYDKALAWVNAELAATEASASPVDSANAGGSSGVRAANAANPVFAPPPSGCSGRRTRD